MPQKKCIHNRIQYYCKECPGKGICEHNRQKSHCRDCGGASICKHNKRKSRCTDCGGSSICEHNREKSRCADCGTGICPSCGLFQTGGKLCSMCDPKSKTRTKYDETRPEIRVLKHFEHDLCIYPIHDKSIGCGNKSRPDLLFENELRTFYIIVEVDENCHESYTDQCEWSRMVNLTSDLEKPVYWIRFNPDIFRIDGKAQRTRWKSKLETLDTTISHLKTLPEISNNISVIYLYYPNNIIKELTTQEIDMKISSCF